MLNNAEWYNGDDHEGYCQGGILYPLYELFLTTGGYIQESPRSFRIQLCLVPAESPDVHDPHDLVVAALHHLPALVLDTHHLLTVEGDDQHGALLHHLPIVQCDTVDV